MGGSRVAISDTDSSIPSDMCECDCKALDFVDIDGGWRLHDLQQ
jgi:hypothetical protein